MTISKSLKTALLAQLILPIVLLILGIYHGLLQVFYRAGYISEADFAGLSYYQGLTLHGVINAIVLTTFFAVAFGHAIMAFYLKKEPNGKLVWISTALMYIGTLMAAYAMLTGQANVLYTFYPPLKAHWTFYIGAALLVVGSWVAFLSWIPMYTSWKNANPGEKTPLAVLGNMINFTIWFFCSLAVAVEILFFLFPWSVGWIETVNVTLCRTLFWFFGHALVYFWLLPSYIMFYTMIPKLAGGKLYSDMAGRLALFLFLIFSIPVGVHHQFSDPGITRGVKLFHTILTYGVAVPSFITAFTIAASLEYAGRKNGSRGLFGWMFKLPYFDKDRFMFAYLIAGLIIFIFGGLTGLVNASYNLNNVVHNTAWMPGHFHMTVAGPVFLSIIGMSLYLLNKLTGKPIKFPRLNVTIPYLWIIGMLIFSTGLSWGGLIGEPRRTDMGMSYLNPDSPLYQPQWVIPTTLTAVGGVIMTIAGFMYIFIFLATALSSSKAEGVLEIPTTEVLHDEPRSPWLDNLKPWLVVMIFLILVAYIPAIRDALKYSGPGSPTYDPASPVPISSEK